MKSRKAQLARKLELHENARKRLDTKEAKRAQSDLRQAVESMNGVYMDQSMSIRMDHIRQDDPTCTMNSYSRQEKDSIYKQSSLKEMRHSGSNSTLARRLREHAMQLRKREESNKRVKASEEVVRENETFQVILPQPCEIQLQILPPQECQVVRNLSPAERFQIQQFEKK